MDWIRNSCHRASDVVFGPLVTYSADRLSSSLQLPPYFLALLLATEDKRFLIHPGVDPIAMTRACIANLFGASALEGASTIPQQLYDARRELSGLDRPRNFWRKWHQAGSAVVSTVTHSKLQNLDEYLAIVYWGRNYYGLDAATQGYFKATRREISLAQGFFFAERLASPNVMNAGRIQTLLRRPYISGFFADADLDEVARIYHEQFGFGGRLCDSLERSHRRLAALTSTQ
jgi:membrane peptidoglycan carboxypeptidase